MSGYIGLGLSFLLIIFGVLNKLFIGYILCLCLGIFIVIALMKGYPFANILRMAYEGGQKSFVVLKVFFLIGGIIGVWLCAGTIQTLVYFSLSHIAPYTFVVLAFLISCCTSFLIGSALGTVGIIGIPLMIIARSGSMDVNIITGAIIAGAYFGDRCSPMASSAALVASLTDTDLFKNIRNMLRTAVIPMVLSVLFYSVLSYLHPLKVVNNDLPLALAKTFRISGILLIPAVIILVLSLCRVNIKTSIPISLFSAFLLAVFYQHCSVQEVLHSMIFGFKLNDGSPLQEIIKGGGILSMVKVSLVVFVSCALAGIFEGIHMLEGIKAYLSEKNLSSSKLFAVTAFVSALTSAFGCNQSMSMIMTKEIMKDCYSSSNKYDFALHLENSGILICALLPWNLAALVPTSTLKVSFAGYIPYGFFLYIVPLVYYIQCKRADRRVQKQELKESSEAEGA